MKKVSLIKKGVLCCAFALCVAMAGENAVGMVQAEEAGGVMVENSVGEDGAVSKVEGEPEVLAETFGVLTYKVIIGGTIAITDCDTSAVTVEIPETIDGMSVVIIDYKAFENCTNLTELVIPDSVAYIGNYAFSGCTNLSKIAIPEGITDIGYGLFKNCSSLTEIQIPEDVTRIGDDAFAACGSLTEIDIPQNVTYIGSGAFDGCSNLKTVIMSDAVTTIGKNAFYNCSSLEEIVLSKNVNVLNESTFYNCSSLKKVVLPENLITISGAIGTEGVFTNCTSLEEIIIPENVTEIGKFAFSKCSCLKEIVIPKNVSKIGMEAFSYCSGVEKVTIQGDVETIDTGAFRGLSNLKEITISGDIQSSFGGSHLEKITFTEGVTSVNLSDWDIINFCKVYIPKSATSVSGIEAIIYGYTGSEAEAYAERTGTIFIPLDVPMETYTVSTGAELEAAIGSNRRIILKDGTYNLTWSTINRVASLIIEAENEGKAEIVDPSSTSPVIRISNSSDVQIKGLILGHESARGNDEIGDDPCGAMSEAYVIEIRFSKDISIENCDLYGCGLEGIRCASVQGLNVENCVIRDCKSYAFNEYEDWSKTGKDIRITNCIISGNAYEEKYFGYSLIRATEETVFENCIIFNNGNRALSTFKGEPIELEMNNCTFYDNAFEGKTPKAYGICLNGITWQVDGEELRIGYPLTMEDGTVIESEKGYILNYSDSSLPWKNYTDKKIVLAEGVKNEVKLGDVVEEWQKEPTLYVYERGIMTGKGTLENGDVKFDPNAPLTRPEFAQILFAEEGKPTITTDKAFNDLVAGEWYVNAVLWAAENEIVSGYTNGAFGVADNITREQLALMLYKYAQLKGYDTTASTELDKFADAGTASPWAVPSLKWAVANGVLSGAGENLKPAAIATRAECAAMIRTFMTKFEVE